MKIKLILKNPTNIQYYHSSVIEIEIEEYLKGVVASEIGNASLEACKAQAVAARTFAFIKYSSGKQLTDQSNSDQAFRVSRLSSSYPNAQIAVEETVGQILYYNSKLINCCPYSDSNGGYIKSSKEVWGGERAWLQSKLDPYDTGTKNGHGVGMSQNGAKTMASLGLTYKDILSFYYPGTIIVSDYGSKKQESEVVKVAYQAKVTASSGNTVNMRQTPSSAAKVISQIAVGQVVDVISAADEWSTITWNGKSGYMMTKFLTKVSGSENNNVWYVRIECDSEAQAKAIAQILNKAKAAT